VILSIFRSDFITKTSHITKERRHTLLTMLSDELVKSNLTMEIVLCGGAVMLMEGERKVTDDLDSVKQMTARQYRLVEKVGIKFNLLYPDEPTVVPDDWLNDKSYDPAPRNLPYTDYEIFPNLRVSHLTPEAMLASKIQASRLKDYSDIKYWVDSIGVRTREELELLCEMYGVALTVADAVKEQNDKFSEFDDGGHDNNDKQYRIAVQKIEQRLSMINRIFSDEDERKGMIPVHK